MSDISNQLIKDSYNYVLQSDLSTGIVYRIGGGIPVNPKFLSGLTINTSFNFSNGTEQNGYVLTSDSFGNAIWKPDGSSSGNFLPLSGGTVTGPTIFTSGLTANTFSASTYLGLPIDIRVTGATKSGTVATFTNNTGGTFTLTGLTDTIFTGGTVTGATTFTGGLTANTISSTTYNGYVPLPTQSSASTGVVLSFITDTVYGTLASPETSSAITANVSGALLGVTNIVIHSGSTAPTFSSQYKRLSGSSTYSAGTINYIFTTFITSTEIIYSINQRT